MHLQTLKEKKYKLIYNTAFISTIFNEEKSLPAFLKSFFEQDYLPAEMIFVDGGSSDRTLDILKKFFQQKAADDFGLKSYDKSDSSCISGNDGNAEICGCYEISFYSRDKNLFKTDVLLLCKKNTGISEGRNIAIKNSKSEIICASDAGCIFDKNWIFEITRFLSGNSGSENSTINKTNDVAGGYSKPIAISFMEKVLSMCIMPQLKEINAKNFMPSSRNIGFKKSAWIKVGGYPENMDFGEDMKFNFNLKESGYGILFNPKAVVFWRMRENLYQVFKQFFRYAKGDAIGRMYLNRHLIRFSTLFDFIIIIIISIFLGPWFLLVLLPFFIFYVFKPFFRLNATFRHLKNGAGRFFVKIAALALCPLMLAYIDIAKMSGFIYGLVKK